MISILDFFLPFRSTAVRQTGSFRGVTFLGLKTLFCWALPSISHGCDIKNPLCSSLLVLEILQF